MIAKIQALKKTAGIYSNIFMWKYYLGETQCQDLNVNLATWYPHDDKLPNFYDFTQFGNYGPYKNYKLTTLKQYKLDSTLCSISGNVDQINMTLD